MKPSKSFFSFLFILLFLPSSIFLSHCFAAGYTLGGDVGASSPFMARPPNVPLDYVATPFGFFHPSCVGVVSEGHSLGVDGKIRNSKGAFVDNAPLCSHPSHPLSGDSIGLAPSVSPSSSLASLSSPVLEGWIESQYRTGTETTTLTSYWKVPNYPLVEAGQVVYFFNGLENYAKHNFILQPVLTYQYYRWSIAAWNCCLNGMVWQGPSRTVYPGHVISGSLIKFGTQYLVTAVDQTTHASSGLLANVLGETMDWAFSAVLEVHSVGSCDQLPPEGSVLFYNISINGAMPNRYTIYQQPFNCGYGVTRPQSNRVLLSF